MKEELKYPKLNEWFNFMDDLISKMKKVDEKIKINKVLRKNNINEII